MGAPIFCSMSPHPVSFVSVFSPSHGRYKARERRSMTRHAHKSAEQRPAAALKGLRSSFMPEGGIQFMM